MFAVLVFLACGTMASAQDSSMSSHDTMSTNGMMSHNGMNHHNYLEMKNGKMTVVRNGNSTDMTHSMTLRNGTVVMTDGTVKMKNGHTEMLTDGQCVYMNGTVGKSKM